MDDAASGRPEESPERSTDLDPDTVHLIRRVQAGDQDAAAMLFERYSPRVKQIVALRLGRPVSALADQDDIVQEALLRAYRAIERFDTFSPGTFHGYLARCVRSAIVDERRRAAARRSVSEFDLGASLFPSAEPTPSRVAQGRELNELIERSLLALSDRHRNVLILRALQGMSYDEIAKALQVTRESARVICHHARRRLEEEISRRGGLDA